MRTGIVSASLLKLCLACSLWRSTEASDILRTNIRTYKHRRRPQTEMTFQAPVWKEGR